MARLEFTYVDGSALETIGFDATISEVHAHSAAVTDWPVETGGSTSDHVRALPISLRLDAFVSDFPTESNVQAQRASSAFVRPSVAYAGRAQNVLNSLIQLKDQGARAFVSTAVRNYPNMVVQSVSVNRDKSVAGGLRLDISLREVRVVNTQTAVVVAAEPKGQTPVREGPKSGVPATPAEAAKAKAASGSFGVDIFKAAGVLR